MAEKSKFKSKSKSKSKAESKTDSKAEIKAETKTDSKIDSKTESKSAKAAPAQPQSRFEVLKVYVKDASFEAPATPQIFLERSEKPEIGVDVLVDYKSVDDKQGLVEVILDITITAKIKEQTMYIVEVHQAGIFHIVHPKADTKRFIVEVTSPHMLLPFAREALNNLITKGGFNSFLLSPVNFEAIYRDKLKREQDMDKGKGTDSNPPDPIN